jgi:hypothetical protein
MVPELISCRLLGVFWSQKYVSNKTAQVYFQSVKIKYFDDVPVVCLTGHFYSRPLRFNLLP